MSLASPPRTASRPCLLVACAVVLVGASGSLRADSVKWRTDYAAALKEAAQKGQPLFVNVGTTDCYWCKQLDIRTFIDADITKVLADRCVPLKLDASDASNAYLVKALKVQSYPTLIFAGPDGSIVGYREGFLEPAALKEQLTKVLTAVGTPDWMQRDFDAAGKAVAAADFGKAISLLKSVLEDGKARPVQVRARAILAELEKHASERAGKAKELADGGKTTEALAELDAMGKAYPGTLAARRGKEMMAELASRAAPDSGLRQRQAAEILRQAREDYKSRQYLVALDRCEDLQARFTDTSEATAAEKLAAEIKENAEWSKAAAEQLGERMCVLYASLAETLLKKGEPQQAVFYLERIVKLFPASKHAEVAQQKLARLRGGPDGAKK